MTLTPEDVHKKTFTPVRLREGYDMGEVDQFLDEVEVELTRLHAENDDVRAKLETAQGAASSPTSTPTVRPSQTTSDSTSVSAAEAEAVSAAHPLPAVRTVPEAASAAARLLELATNNADQLVGEAQVEADKIVAEARTKAERLESTAKTTSDQIEADARGRAEALDSDISERRQQLIGDIERDKDSLARELEELRAFEREYRSRLRGYFQSQLRSLDGADDEPSAPTPAGDGETPRRLQELLGEEPQS